MEEFEIKTNLDQRVVTSLPELGTKASAPKINVLHRISHDDAMATHPTF